MMLCVIYYQTHILNKMSHFDCLKNGLLISSKVATVCVSFNRIKPCLINREKEKNSLNQEYPWYFKFFFVRVQLIMDIFEFSSLTILDILEVHHFMEITHEANLFLINVKWQLIINTGNMMAKGLLIWSKSDYTLTYWIMLNDWCFFFREIQSSTKTGELCAMNENLLTPADIDVAHWLCSPLLFSNRGWKWHDTPKRYINLISY